MDVGAFLACDLAIAVVEAPTDTLRGNARFRALIPGADGQPLPEVWTTGHIVELPADRHGRLALSVIGDATVVVAVDVTAQVRAERGLRILRALAACTGETTDDVLCALASVLASDPDDFPRAMLYARWRLRAQRFRRRR